MDVSLPEINFAFNSPLTWVLAEVFSVVLLLICTIHAVKREKPAIRLLELYGFVLAAGLFENVGVAANIYDYNLNRFLLFGKVPFAILFFEAVIVYASLLLAERLKLPKWAIPLAVGFFASVQDMTIDPSAVFDTHTLDGVLSGRWNWQNMGYADGLFGIPFFNFSGWLYMVAYYTAFILIGRWLHKKYEDAKYNEWIGIAYPILAGIFVPLALATPINTFLLFVFPFYPLHTRTPELVMMIINLAVPFVLLLLYGKLKYKIDLQKDWVIFFIPVSLHIWDVIIAFFQKIESAYFPSIVIGLLHIGLLGYYYFANQQLEDAETA